MNRYLTCITCPMGCELEVGFMPDGKEIKYVKGNTCPRGEKYAIAECTHPERVITSTVLCSDGSVVPVKTNAPIPKEFMFDCMKIINNIKIDLPIHTGDVIIRNVLDTKADVICVIDKGI